MCWYVLIHIYAFTGVAMNPGYINASVEQLLPLGYIYLLLEVIMLIREVQMLVYFSMRLIEVWSGMTRYSSLVLI